MKADTLRNVADAGGMVDDTDLGGLVLGIGVWLLIMVAAPLLVLILAVLLLSVEIPVAIALGLLLAIVRFTGIVPWTVTVTDTLSGAETHEKYRNLIRAVRRIRTLNTDQHVPVRWAWT